MGPYSSSDKCTCPHCVRTRRIIAECDQQRRDTWKRRACQHHIDQAGVCTGESGCSCPNCREYREFYRLRPGESYHRVHTGHDDRSRMVKWIWVRRPGGWRRKDLKTNRIFGPFVRYVSKSALYAEPCPQSASYTLARAHALGVCSIRDEVIIHTTNPNSADSWVQAIFTDPPAYVSRDQATEFYRAHGLDLPWADPPRKSDLFSPEVRAAFLHGDWTEKKEHPVPLMPLHHAILFHYSAFPTERFQLRHATDGSDGDACDAHLVLISADLLEHTTVIPGYRLTDRAKVLLNAISALPLPVRKPAPWTMPT